MEWITKHLAASAATALVLLGILAATGRKFSGPLWAAWKLYRAAQKELHASQERLAETQGQLAAGYQGLTSLTERQLTEAKRECDELRSEAKELRRVLADQVLATQVRDDIIRQNLALIRAFKARMRESRVDFSDIEDSIQRQFGSE
jgi:uncharacterized membrane-anchored protein